MALLVVPLKGEYFSDHFCCVYFCLFLNMAWKGTEEAFLACYTLVNIDINDTKFVQEVPQLNSEGQCMLLAHFEKFVLTTENAFSSEVLKRYLQSPVTELYKNGVVNVPVIPKGQSNYSFSSNVITLAQ